MKKPRGGFTLLEAAIALALWVILAAGVVLVWQHTARASAELFARQSAFENARAAMDAILMNLQMARDITLETDGGDVLRRLTLAEFDPLGRPHDYRFYFDAGAQPGTAKHHRLEFGTNNEFAENIAMVRVRLSGGKMRVFIATGCPEPITLEGSVDVRYKNVEVIQTP